MDNFIYKWQEIIGAIIGASTPFVLWWFAEKYRQYREKKEYLYYLERLLVDQINTIIDVRNTIEAFINERLEKITTSIKSSTGSSAYSVDFAFFPMFSIRSLNDGIHIKTTASNYIDNKIGQAYKLSNDMPFIFDDLRRQFSQTTEMNKEISFNKLNSPDAQRDFHLTNLNEFKEIVKRDILNKNIPLYLKHLMEARVSLNELSRIGILRWRLRFDPRFQFFLRGKDYQRAKDEVYDKIESFFEKKVQKSLTELASRPKNN